MKRKPIKLAEMVKFRDKILKGLMPWVDQRIDEAAMSRLTEIICGHLLAERVVVQLSIAEFFNQVLTFKSARLLAWRMAANKDRIRRGETVTSATAFRYAGPCVIKVIEANDGFHTTRDGKTRSGARVVLEIQTGPAVGAKVVKFWSSRFCSQVARKDGLWPKHQPLPHVSLLYGAYFVAMLTPTPTSEDRIVIGQVVLQSPMRSRNRKLQDRRNRKNFNCPLGRPTFESLPCHRCPVGSDRCPAATREKTYTVKICRRCDKSAYHTDFDSVECVECRAVNRGRA